VPTSRGAPDTLPGTTSTKSQSDQSIPHPSLIVAMLDPDTEDVFAPAITWTSPKLSHGESQQLRLVYEVQGERSTLLTERSPHTLWNAAHWAAFTSCGLWSPVAPTFKSHIQSTAGFRSVPPTKVWLVSWAEAESWSQSISALDSRARAEGAEPGTGTPRHPNNRRAKDQQSESTSSCRGKGTRPNPKALQLFYVKEANIAKLTSPGEHPACG